MVIKESIQKEKNERLMVSFPFEGLMEVIRLKIEDINGKIMLIHLKGSKGRKDR